jgi:hypothetical protein
MQNSLKTLFSLILLNLSCVIVFAQVSDTIAEHYKTHKFDCAIFSANNRNNNLKDYYTTFTPTHAIVDKAESCMRRNMHRLDSMSLHHNMFVFIRKHFSKYRRQYRGFINKDGHHILSINCFLLDKDDVHEFDYWLKEMVLVCDGGEYYWGISFDLDTNSFFNLHINGYA